MIVQTVFFSEFSALIFFKVSRALQRFAFFFIYIVRGEANFQDLMRSGYTMPPFSCPIANNNNNVCNYYY